MHEITEEQLHYLMFNRHASRFIGTTLPQVDDEIDISVALEVMKQTSRDNSRKWLARENMGRKDQTVDVGDLVWVKKGTG